MTDLSQLLATVQRPEVSHIDMVKCRAKGTLQWFLEYDHKTHPVYDNNQLQFFMGGQEGFAALEKDIQRATRSIDLVLWGFDPGMALTRSRTTWPHGTPYGELLVEKARQGVKVRLLLWYVSPVINIPAGNVPDFPSSWLPVSLSSKTGVTWPAGASNNNARTHPAWVLTDRANFCTQWWKDALSGAFENLEVRLRRGHPVDINANLNKYLPDSRRDLTESASMTIVGTHHQKPVLIDYEAAAAGQRRNACAYVMGLNSVTEYWDTVRHGFNDPMRELSADGPGYTYSDSDRRWHRKPYRDYAIRVEGEALYSINQNFVEGWDRADGVALMPGAVGPVGALGKVVRRNGAGLFGGPTLAQQRQAIQRKDIPVPAGARCRVQVQRTQPEAQDGTILKGYTLASANAVNYIFVENQYFQLAEWPRMLKDLRKRYREGMCAAGAKPADTAPLYLFVVIPQPERGQMVPRTYDTVGGLGAGAQMGTYDRRVQGERQRRQAGERAKGGSVGASVDAVPADAKAQLDDLGIETLVAMLMTWDADNEARHIRIRARDNDAQAQAAAQQSEKNAKAGVNAGQPDDVDPQNLTECTITPGRYREIYIHSKLMFVDDVYTTLGSANLNARSMAADSELNLCTEEWAFTKAARKRVWGNLAGNDLDGGECDRQATAETHKDWLQRMLYNQYNRSAGKAPIENSFIHPFEDSRDAPLVKLA
ncbi:MAG: phospholipase D-like domain-containing protein [Variovorax sp.]|nr:phospholipase D-like domain-containing protein [Variovorax sp.]